MHDSLKIVWSDAKYFFFKFSSTNHLTHPTSYMSYTSDALLGVLIYAHEFVLYFVVLYCCIFCRGEIFDTHMSPLASLRFIMFEGKCERNGMIFPFYYFKIPRNTFEKHLLVNNVNSRGAQVIWDAWVMTVQGLVQRLLSSERHRRPIRVRSRDWWLDGVP